jgi:hypothetical protein
MSGTLTGYLSVLHQGRLLITFRLALALVRMPASGIYVMGEMAQVDDKYIFTVYKR